MHGRAWAAVASRSAKDARQGVGRCRKQVGSKTSEQCMHKVTAELAAGRMQELAATRTWSSLGGVIKVAEERRGVGGAEH
jgi:hypothetical protein